MLTVFVLNGLMPRVLLYLTSPSESAKWPVFTGMKKAVTNKNQIYSLGDL